MSVDPMATDRPDPIYQAMEADIVGAIVKAREAGKEASQTLETAVDIVADFARAETGDSCLPDLAERLINRVKEVLPRDGAIVDGAWP